MSCAQWKASTQTCVVHIANIMRYYILSLCLSVSFHLSTFASHPFLDLPVCLVFLLFSLLSFLFFKINVRLNVYMYLNILHFFDSIYIDLHFGLIYFRIMCAEACTCVTPSAIL